MISAWEIQVKNDAIIQAELEDIFMKAETKAYYHMLKNGLGRTLMAAVVIASEKVSPAASTPGTLVNGICKLSSLASASLPIVAPIAGFVGMIANVIDTTISYRDMQRHLRWVELDEIPAFSATLARRLTLAQKQRILDGMSHAEQSTWEKIKDQFTLFCKELKSGQALTEGERRAVLDLQHLFQHILNKDNVDNMTLSGRVDLLLRHMMGQAYVYTPPMVVGGNTISKGKSKATKISEIIPTSIFSSSSSANPSQHELEVMRQEMAAMKLASEKDQQTKQELEKKIKELQSDVHGLKQREDLLSTASITPQVSIHVDTGGDQQQLKIKSQVGQSSASNASGNTLILYKKMSQHAEQITTLTDTTVECQDQLASLEKTVNKLIDSTPQTEKHKKEKQNANSECCMM
jgi:predicted  nucleic acid-binding Zn-ribbon protein